MEKLIKILESIKPGVDFNKENHLISDGILTSFDIVTLIANLTDEYDIEITVKDIIPENFESAETIMKLINSKEE
jgi:D-alanine--poly(phosphoribitol) ligase subunit 2